MSLGTYKGELGPLGCDMPTSRESTWFLPLYPLPTQSLGEGHWLHGVYPGIPDHQIQWTLLRGGQKWAVNTWGTFLNFHVLICRKTCMFPCSRFLFSAHFWPLCILYTYASTSTVYNSKHFQISSTHSQRYFGGSGHENTHNCMPACVVLLIFHLMPQKLLN